jgi:hypothetical protein
MSSSKGAPQYPQHLTVRAKSSVWRALRHSRFGGTLVVWGLYLQALTISKVVSSFFETPTPEFVRNEMISKKPSPEAVKARQIDRLWFTFR